MVLAKRARVFIDGEFSEHYSSMLDQILANEDLKLNYDVLKREGDRRREAYALREQGHTYVQIAEKLGLPAPASARSRVITWARMQGLDVPRSVGHGGFHGYGYDNMPDYWFRRARHEHAWAMRVHYHESFKQIGVRLGVSGGRALQIFRRECERLKYSWKAIDQLVRDTRPHGR